METFVNLMINWSPVFLIAAALTDMLIRQLFEKGYSAKEDVLSVISALGAKLSVFVMPVWLLHELPTKLAWDYGLTTIPVNWATLLLLFVLCDFAYYWEHRLSHSIRWFWTAHEVHHTAERVTMATGIRISWIRTITLMVIFRLPLIFIGFHPTWVAVMTVAVGIFQVLVHNEEFPKVKWFDAVFVSPSNHRTHHLNDWHQNKNFGGALIVWDRFFGTYSPEPDDNDHKHYGLKWWKKTTNPFVMNLHGQYSLWKDVFSAPDFISAVQIPFRRPGWRPVAKEVDVKLTKQDI